MRLRILARTRCATLSFTLLAACSGQNETAKHPAPAAKPAHPLMLSADEIHNAGISVAVVQIQRQSETLRLTGTIVPDQTRIAKILPILPGRIVTIRVNQGDSVDSGQILAVLESTDLGEARAVFRQAKSEASLADAALERAQQLTVDDVIPKKTICRPKLTPNGRTPHWRLQLPNSDCFMSRPQTLVSGLRIQFILWWRHSSERSSSKKPFAGNSRNSISHCLPLLICALYGSRQMFSRKIFPRLQSACRHASLLPPTRARNSKERCSISVTSWTLRHARSRHVLR